MTQLPHKRLYIGCGPSPIHPQHLAILGDPRAWTFIDKYVVEPHIKNWDGRFLKEVPDSFVEEIYASHVLEHFEHDDLEGILLRWYEKMAPNAKITINVPDVLWALKRFQRLDEGTILDGYYNTWSGEHGVLSILFGSQSHEGEYHKAAFTKTFLHDLLLSCGFVNVDIEQTEDAHDMGVLIATCRKSAS